MYQGALSFKSVTDFWGTCLNTLVAVLNVQKKSTTVHSPVFTKLSYLTTLSGSQRTTNVECAVTSATDALFSVGQCHETGISREVFVKNFYKGTEFHEDSTNSLVADNTSRTDGRTVPVFNRHDVTGSKIWIVKIIRINCVSEIELLELISKSLYNFRFCQYQI
jgi:hypothetical protein